MKEKKETTAQPIDIKYVAARTNVAQTWSFQMLLFNIYMYVYMYITDFVFVQILYFFLIQSWKSVCF